MKKLLVLVMGICLMGGATMAQTPGQQNNRYSFAYLNDSLATTGTAGFIANMFNSREPFQHWSMSVTPTTVGTVWQVLLQGSLDGTNWTTLATANGPTNSGQIVVNSVTTPVLYARTYAASVTGTVQAIAIGVW